MYQILYIYKIPKSLFLGIEGEKQSAKYSESFLLTVYNPDFVAAWTFAKLSEFRLKQARERSLLQFFFHVLLSFAQ